MLRSIVLICTILLSSCVIQQQREIEKDEIIATQRLELLEAIALDRKLKEPENITRPFVTRTYRTDDGPISIIEPEDVIFSSEIYHASKLRRSSSIIIPNAFYWMPSREFVERKLLPAWREHLHKGQIKYNTKYVCHNFSNDFSVFIHI